MLPTVKKIYIIYVDDLSVALSARKTGCVISDTSLNHVCYADDLCIMSASPVLTEIDQLC